MPKHENNDTSPAGKVALVTGAARRIGAAVAKALHSVGMNIVLHYRNSSEDAENLHESLNAARTDSACLVRADLLDTAEICRLAEATLNCWQRLDVLVNNASAFYPTPMQQLDAAVWDNMFGIHVKAPFFLAQGLATELIRRRGCIVNVTDTHVRRPLRNYAAYCVTKAALAALTKSLARELAPEVRCNAVAPGAVLWPEHEHYENMHRQIIDRTALKREGSPEDVADAVLFLVCRAGYVTGQTIIVDGGRSLSQ